MISKEEADRIRRSVDAFEKARAAHDPKRYKRGGRYEPEEYQEIAKKAGLSHPPTNEEKGRLELFEFHAERPKNLFAYYEGRAEVGSPVKTWMGDVVGHVIARGSEYRAGRYPGTAMVRISIRSVTGDIYSGSCNLEGGNYCKLKRVGSGASAERHESGKNPRVRRPKKRRVAKKRAVGRKRKRAASNSSHRSLGPSLSERMNRALGRSR
jgi:hypothetical protein